MLHLLSLTLCVYRRSETHALSQEITSGDRVDAKVSFCREAAAAVSPRETHIRQDCSHSERTSRDNRKGSGKSERERDNELQTGSDPFKSESPSHEGRVNGEEERERD